MKSFTRKSLALLISIFFAHHLFAQQNSKVSFDRQESFKIKKSIEKIVNSYVSKNAFEGAILVSKSGQIVFKKSYGFSDRSRNQPTKANSSFLLASLSKPITATLVLMLEEQGKLKLNNTLADYFPEFNNPAGKEITLHHLLSHTSGIPDHFVIEGWFNDVFHSKTSEQEFIKIIAKLPKRFRAGSDYLYSNPGYFLLGKIVEKITQESYSANLKKYIFLPLNMNKSGISAGSQSNVRIVQGYKWSDYGGYREQLVKNMTLFGAGGAIFSNIEDLYRFDLALYSDKLLKNKIRLFNRERPYSWKIGTMPIGRLGSVNFQTYNGQIEGYSSMMTRFFDDRHSIILLSNTGMNYFLKQQLTFDIASVLYNQDIPNRKKDAALALTKSIFTGKFEQALDNLNSEKLELNEQGITSIAFQLLWSGLATKSLQLFSLTRDKFKDSSTARDNLLLVCKHRLTKNVKNKTRICDSVL